MGRGADQLDAAIEGALVGVRADKGWQEAMMNVDNLVEISPDKKRLQNLHIAGQDQKIDLAEHKFEHALLVLLALLLAHRKMIVGDAIHARQGLQIKMIAENKGDIHRQFAAFPAPEHVGETMIQFRDQDAGSFALARIRDAPLHLEALSNRLKGLGKPLPAQRKTLFREADAHKELAFLFIGGMLVGLQNIAIVRENKLRD